MSLVSELRRRNVLRMVVLYVIAAWPNMQVAEESCKQHFSAGNS